MQAVWSRLRHHRHRFFRQCRPDSQLRSDAFTPIRNLILRVKLPDAVRVVNVRRLWEDRELASQVTGRILWVDIGTLDEYEAVAVELESK